MAEPQGDSTTSADGAGGDAEDGGSDGPVGRYQIEIDRRYHCQYNHFTHLEQCSPICPIPRREASCTVMFFDFQSSKFRLEYDVNPFFLCLPLILCPYT